MLATLKTGPLRCPHCDNCRYRPRDTPVLSCSLCQCSFVPPASPQGPFAFAASAASPDFKIPQLPALTTVGVLLPPVVPTARHQLGTFRLMTIVLNHSLGQMMVLIRNESGLAPFRLVTSLVFSLIQQQLRLRRKTTMKTLHGAHLMKHTAFWSRSIQTYSTSLKRAYGMIIR